MAQLYEGWPHYPHKSPIGAVSENSNRKTASLSSKPPFFSAMDSVAASAANPFSSPLSIFSPKKSIACKRPHLLSVSSKGNEDEADLHSKSENTSLVPFPKNPSSLSRLSKDAAMDLVLSAVVGTGWTTGSGMEGPSDSSTDRTVSTFPWSLFTKSPRRRMLVAFTCKVCGQRTTRAINPHAYTDGTVFVQCCGCFVFHKLVDNLNLFQDMKCYVGSSFQYKEDGSFDSNDDGNIFPIL